MTCQTSCGVLQFEEGNDWSSALASNSPKSTDVRHITGTLIAAPLSVLRGQRHTVSSMLEGVFLSVYSIACDGKLPRHLIRNDRLLDWEIYRAGSLQRMQLPVTPSVIGTLRPLVDRLHDLFFPVEVGRSSRGYCETVTVAAFQAACERACKKQLHRS